MMYWFPLQAWIGKKPVPSVYNLLMGVTCINSSLERIWGIGSSGELVFGVLGLVDLTFGVLGRDATIMGHVVQKLQGGRSTKPKPPTKSSPKYPIPRIRSNELFIQVTPISKLYTDDTGRSPIHARSGNQYIMIAYHCDANLILAVPFKSRKDTHRLLAYDKLIQRLRDHELTVDLQILDNESIAEYKKVIQKNGTLIIN